SLSISVVYRRQQALIAIPSTPLLLHLHQHTRISRGASCCIGKQYAEGPRNRVPAAGGHTMSSGPSNDPIVQQLQLLLTGYGYNFYNTTNQARADDLLVRERPSYFLSQAVSMLAQLRSDYSMRFIPPLTRANPDPPQEAMAQIREIEAAQQALSS